jgi:ribosomal protein L24
MQHSFKIDDTVKVLTGMYKDKIGKVIHLSEAPKNIAVDGVSGDYLIKVWFKPNEIEKVD